MGSQKTEAGFDPESTDAEEHLEKLIAVRILSFTVSHTNRNGSMGNIIHRIHIDNMHDNE